MRYEPAPADIPLELALAATYTREVRAGIERIWENVLDWEHLPALHEIYFNRVALIDSGSWGWRVELTKAPGLDKVVANCSGCHSLDYIVMNSPYPNAALWDAEVTKMIKAFGAPIDEADAKEIAAYLKKNYGS